MVFSKILSFRLILQSVMVEIIVLGVYPEMHQNNNVKEEKLNSKGSKPLTRNGMLGELRTGHR